MTITEKYFRAIGWSMNSATGDPESSVVWITGNGNEEPFKIVWPMQELPDITQSFPDFKKWVLEKMEGEIYRFTTRQIIADDGTGELELQLDIIWVHSRLAGEYPAFTERLKNNEILEAAVVAATRYFEGKK